MGRRGGPNRRRKRRLILYSVPLLALAILLGVYYVATVSPQPKEDFTVPISIQLVQLIQGGHYISYIPPVNVGVRGGFWFTHQYDGEGINGHYPVYGQESPGGNSSYSLIHVRSTVSRTYTLLDFFNVWGKPLGPNDTLTFTVPPPASDTRFTNQWFWDLCIRIGSGGIIPGSWTNQSLVPGEGIVLRYSDDGCRPLT